VKFLDSGNQRLLIADEVGLGKTIEAGLIYHELNARHELDRVLVVCPSALCPKWREEMARRFEEDFQILDTEDIREFLRLLEQRGSAVRLRGIASLQTLRSEETLGLMEAASPPLDLVIVDEAHHMRNSGTLSNDLGNVLSESADAMLMLTATPIHLGNENLYQLLHILDPHGFDDFVLFGSLLEANKPVIQADRILRGGGQESLAQCRDTLRQVEHGPARQRFLESPIYRMVLDKLARCDGADRAGLVEIQRDLAHLNLLGHILTRTRKRETATNPPMRQASIVPVKWTDSERDIYDDVTEYCRRRAVVAMAELGVAAWFPLVNLQRQIASSIPGALRHYLGAETAEFAQEEMSDIEPDDFLNGLGGQAEIPSIRDDPALRSILRKAQAAITVDSKLQALLCQLRLLEKAEPGRKIVIFSYFKKTLEYLGEELVKQGFGCIVITGDVPSRPMDPDNDERGKRFHRFKADHGVRIMLSSEVGSEGLDFQFASILINYDLPWNPMVVEQRIGRLDRLGQKADRILIYNFSVPGTIEDRILSRLYDRIRIFEESIGDLEAILGTEIRELTHALLTSRLTPEEETERIEHVAATLERRRQEAKDLENRAAQFIGQDEYFTEQLREIHDNRRYVMPEEVETLIGDFLWKEFPASSWEPGGRPGYFQLQLDPECSRFFQAMLRRFGIRDWTFADRALRGPLTVTCMPESAVQDEEVELINGQHPFVRAIIEYYVQHSDRLPPTSCISVTTSTASAADYAYFVFVLEQHAVRSGTTLEPVFMSIVDGRPLPPDAAEHLLSEMVICGTTLMPALALPVERVDELWQVAQEVLSETVRRKRAELERNNADLIARQLATLRASYQSKRGKKSALLEKAVAAGRQPQYIRMLEGTIRKIDSAQEQREREIEFTRRVAVGSELIAVGLVRVV
jgi:superfamily II DNA or RNA helicase